MKFKQIIQFRPGGQDLIIINKETKICQIVDVAATADYRVKLKESDKVGLSNFCIRAKNIGDKK